MSDEMNAGQGLAHLPPPTVLQRAPHDVAPPPPSMPSADPLTAAAPSAPDAWAGSPIAESIAGSDQITTAPPLVLDPQPLVVPAVPEQPAAWSGATTEPTTANGVAQALAEVTPAAYAVAAAPAVAEAAVQTAPIVLDQPAPTLNGHAVPGPEPIAIPSQSRDAAVAVAPIEVMHHDRSPAAAGANLAELDARNISAWFGDHKVLDRVSLLMPAGQVTALIGPSGCGKSTFLRILNRMHELIPSASMAGEVVLDGQDVYAPERRLTEARRHIGMVFQKPNPFPAMTIYDNVIAGLQLTGTKASNDEKDRLVEECLTKAGLWKEVRDRLRSPGGGLSGGQQQRLCIARSLAIKPRVLLMDEPCSALDPTSTRRIEETILELVSEVTIVIVTHNMQQAARVSDQCAFFLASAGTPGVIVEYGATDAMFNSPVDERTHDYVNGRFG